jgi:hypothetical protein
LRKKIVDQYPRVNFKQDKIRASARCARAKHRWPRNAEASRRDLFERRAI